MSLNKNEPGKKERLEARLNHSQKKLMQHAADLVGRSLSDFVVSSTQEAALRVIREHEIISMTAKDSKQLVEALLNPPEANTVLKKAAHKHNKRSGS